jgi:hypothetical protein
VDEHAEAKVYELLLELMEALVLGRCFVTKTYEQKAQEKGAG